MHSAHLEAAKKSPPPFEEFKPLSEDFPSLSQASSAYLKDSIKRLERNTKPNPNAASFVPGGFQPPSPQPPPQAKPRSADLVWLQEGIDLTQLGLSDRKSSSLLESPFTGLAASEPEFGLPACYSAGVVSLKPSHLQKFSLSTLFYLFYSMPGQYLQTAAAEDLYRREWMFHPPSSTWYRSKGLTERQVFNTQAWAVERTTRVPESLLSRDEVRSQRER
jgi:hypothetical protein